MSGQADLVLELRGVMQNATVWGPDELVARDPGFDSRNFGAAALVRPVDVDVEGVSALVRFCAGRGLSLVPQGGRTGLAGGAGQLHDRRHDFHQCRRHHGLPQWHDAPPPSWSGGRFAGWPRVPRPHARSKDEPGYDLKHLFVGAEGTLGIVTRAVLRLEPQGKASATALIGTKDAASAQRVVRHFLAMSGTDLRAAEIMWRSFASAMARMLGLDRGKLPLDSPCLLALELGAAPVEQATGALEEGLAGLWEEVGILDGLVAASMEQARTIWRLREETEQIERLHEHPPSFDVSVPAGAIDAYVARITDGLKAVDANYVPYVFGHLADGNLHISVNTDDPPPERYGAIEHVLYAGLGEIGGSFSAEHGVGLDKRAAYERYAGPVKRELARSIKQLLDPQGLLNPGKAV